jgi:hypothetical protein
LREIWLDEGEWQLVEGLVMAGDFTPRIHAGVAVRRWRSSMTRAMEEQRLREVLGADYDRVVQFAEWLQAQPAKQEIPRPAHATRTQSQMKTPGSAGRFI